MKKKQIKYIYILSQRYSGSTLLSHLIARDSSISTIGERRKFYNKVLNSDQLQHHRGKHCSCGELFKECEYLNRIKDNVISSSDPKLYKYNATEFYVSNNRYINVLFIKITRFIKINSLPQWLNPFASKIKDLLKFNFTLVKEILKVDNSNIFLDSSKHINHLLLLSMMDGIDLNVIWLVRDPRAQVNSSLKVNKGFDLSYAANNWKSQMVENEKILNVLDMKYHKLRYEDLCKSPKLELENILNIFDIPFTNVDLNFRDKEQHIFGNIKMNLSNDRDIIDRQDWKNELAQDQISSVEEIVSDYMHLYY